MATGLKKKDEKIDKKAEKAASVADITARLKATSTAVLADYRGMTVGQMRELRSKLRSGGIEMIVVKNTLARRAAKGAGYEPLNAELVGPIAMLFAADDVSAPARILNDYIRANRKMVIKAGLLEGQVITTFPRARFCSAGCWARCKPHSATSPASCRLRFPRSPAPSTPFALKKNRSHRPRRRLQVRRNQWQKSVSTISCLR